MFEHGIETVEVNDPNVEVIEEASHMNLSVVMDDTSEPELLTTEASTGEWNETQSFLLKFLNVFAICFSFYRSPCCLIYIHKCVI